MMMYFVRALVALCISLPSIFLTAGCARETLVVTPQQLRYIASLQAHNFVMCRNDVGNIVVRPIDMIAQRYADEVVHIVIGDDELDVAVDQLFFVAAEHRYIRADELTTDHCLTNMCGDVIRIDRIERKHGEVSLVSCSVREHHTFFVTQQGIALHNNITFVAETSTSAADLLFMGAGAITLSVSVPVAAGVIFVGGAYHLKDQIAAAGRAIGRGLAWLFGMRSIGDEAKQHLKKTTTIKHGLHEIDLMADPEPNDDGTYLVYEPSSKHYPVPYRNASPGPGWIEGQLALNLSRPVITESCCSDTRVAYWRKKIVVFELTRRMGKFLLYHGYYQDENTINAMSDRIIKALRKDKIINHRGKIIA